MNKRGDGSISLEERQRLQELRIMEEEAFQEGYNYIAGLDEVGRGPIAAGSSHSSYSTQGFLLPGVDDSSA